MSILYMNLYVDSLFFHLFTGKLFLKHILPFFLWDTSLFLFPNPGFNGFMPFASDLLSPIAIINLFDKTRRINILIVFQVIDVNLTMDLVLIKGWMGVLSEKSRIVDFSMVDFHTYVADTWEKTVVMNFIVTHLALFIFLLIKTIIFEFNSFTYFILFLTHIH